MRICLVVMPKNNFHPFYYECVLGNSKPLNFLIFFDPFLCTFTPAFVTSCRFSAKKMIFFSFSS